MGKLQQIEEKIAKLEAKKAKEKQATELQAVLEPFLINLTKEVKEAVKERPQAPENDYKAVMELANNVKMLANKEQEPIMLTNGSVVKLENEDMLINLSENINRFVELAESDRVVSTQPASQKKADYQPVRITDGKKWISAEDMGGGGVVVNNTGTGGGGGDTVTAIPPNWAHKITEDTANGITYIARAVTGTDLADASWQVQRIDESTKTVDGNTIITWADGNDDFDNVATDLTSLVYS